MADKKKAPQLIAVEAIWTGKVRIEAGQPLPDDISDEQRQHLVKSGAAAEAKKAGAAAAEEVE